MTDLNLPPRRKIWSCFIGFALLCSASAALAQSSAPQPAAPAPQAKPAAPAPQPAAAPAPAAQAPAPQPVATHPAITQAATPQAAAAAILPATAATPAAASSKITGGDIERLIGTLDDGPARERLKKQLELLLQAQRNANGTAGHTHTPAPQGFGARTLASLSHHVELVSNALVNLVQGIADLPQRIRQAASVLADPIQRGYWTKIAIDLVGVLVLAFAAGWITRRLLTRLRRIVHARNYVRWYLRLLFLPVVFILEALPILAFGVASYIALPLFEPDEAARLVIGAIVGAQITASLVTAVAAVLFTPAAPGLRLFRIGDETAAYLQVWVRRFAVVVAYGYAITELAAALGIDDSLHDVITRIWGLLVAAMSIIFVLQNRVAVAEWIGGAPDRVDHVESPDGEPVLTPLEPDSRTEISPSVQRFRAFRRQSAKVWHILAIAYIAASYVVWSLQIEGGFEFLLRATVLTAIMLLVIRLADRFLRQVFDRSFALPEDIKRFLPGLEKRTNRYLPALRQTLLVVLYLAATFALLQIWGLDVIGWLSDGSGRPVMAAAFKIAIVLALSVIAAEFVTMVIEHYLRESGPDGRAIQHSARIRTLLPLLRNAFRMVLAVLVTLTVLSEIGIDIGPLLAAAGVVGLAIGFGAQTLVKDLITGVFILIEDTLSLGDVVDLGGHSGVVEGMTVRTIRLRDAAGAVHTVPFSAVTTVINMTKDFSYAVFDISVAYKESVSQVMDVVREVGEEIRNDPVLRFDVLAPIEIQGLDSFGDSAVVIKARIKTQPIKQWNVMRAFNLKLKEAFDREGIEIPFPQQQIHVATQAEASVLTGNPVPAGGTPDAGTGEAVTEVPASVPREPGTPPSSPR